MAGLKELRTRMASVQSTMQVTSAMKMVSIAKLRRAQDSITRLKPYAEKMKEILAHVSGNLSRGEESPYAEQRKTGHVLIILISSNKGLCGAFNVNIAKRAVELARSQYAELLTKRRVDFATIGKKAGDVLKAQGYKITEEFDQVYADLSFNKVAPIARHFMNKFIEKQYDRVHIVYNSFATAATQVVQTEQFLPIQTEEEQQSQYLADYIFEPDLNYIAEVTIPKSLQVQFYKTILDSNASEHGARMTAMHKATDNANELLKELRLNYNKARQNAITNEILEIVGGAEALNG